MEKACHIILVENEDGGLSLLHKHVIGNRHHVMYRKNTSMLWEQSLWHNWRQELFTSINFICIFGFFFQGGFRLLLMEVCWFTMLVCQILVNIGALPSTRWQGATGHQIMWFICKSSNPQRVNIFLFSHCFLIYCILISHNLYITLE